MLPGLSISLSFGCGLRSLPEDSQLLRTLRRASTWISSQISLLLFDSIRYPLNSVSCLVSCVAFEDDIAYDFDLSDKSACGPLERGS